MDIIAFSIDLNGQLDTAREGGDITITVKGKVVKKTPLQVEVETENVEVELESPADKEVRKLQSTNVEGESEDRAEIVDDEDVF